MKHKSKQSVPKTVQESIPYVHVYENGTVETEPGTFTHCYPLNEVNFNLASKDTQTNIFLDYEAFLNSFEPTTDFQIVILNRTARQLDTMSNIGFAPSSTDRLNEYRYEMNAMLAKQLEEGRNTLRQEKYLVTAVHNDDTARAMEDLKRVDGSVDQMLKRIAKDRDTRPLPLEDRLKTLWTIYNQDQEGLTSAWDERTDEKPFDLANLSRQGISTKDVVGPSGMKFFPSYFMLGETYGKALFLESTPSILNTDFLSSLSDVVCNLVISLNYRCMDQTKAARMVRSTLTAIEGQIADRQKKAWEGGYMADLVPSDLRRQRESVERLAGDLSVNNQKMFQMTMSVLVFGKTKEEMDRNVKDVCEIADRFQAPLRVLTFQQEDGFDSALPLALNRVAARKTLTTESAAVFIPYTTQELYQKQGVFYGINAISKNLIFYDRKSGSNYNALIFGSSGSGKSFMAKTEMVSILLKDPKAVVYVIDPEAEYGPLAEQFGGEVVNLAAGSGTYVNPFDMDMDYGEEGDPLSAKIDYIISLIEIMNGGADPLEQEERSSLYSSLTHIYRPYIASIENMRRQGKNNVTKAPEIAPTLADLYNDLVAQPDPWAKRLAKKIEMYATEQGFFAHRSNVDTDSRFVVYNIKNLGSGMKAIGLHVCLNDIWNKVLENSRKGIWTYFYIDEFYLLLRSPSAAAFLMEIWKRARKWRGCPTGIMQNTEDLLATPEARNIINNTGFITAMSLPQIDRMNLKELLGLSDEQLSFITGRSHGEGLVSTEKATIPFIYHFPEDTKLYKLMMTKDKDRSI